ncbi:MAG: polysaccharide deacetylase family protein [Bacteroidia bacterium]|nr:polysaccharide deacetylase family protein [Bacteroidia bacterium]
MSLFAAINYHYVRDHFQAPYPAIFGQTPAELATQVKELMTIARPAGQKELLEIIHTGKMPRTNTFFITFDDGLKEQYHQALPVLESLGVPALFFVNSLPLAESVVMTVHKIHILRSQINPVTLSRDLFEILAEIGINLNPEEDLRKARTAYRYDTPEQASIKYLLNYFLDSTVKDRVVNLLFDRFFPGEEATISEELYMGEKELKSLAEKGFLACHSHAHHALGKLSKNEQEKDIALNKQWIESATGVEMKGFSYPYGSQEACENVGEVLKRNGFTFAFTMERAINHEIGDPFYLSRFDTNDVPLGKSYPYRTEEMFEKFPAKTWTFPTYA